MQNNVGSKKGIVSDQFLHDHVHIRVVGYDGHGLSHVEDGESAIIVVHLNVNAEQIRVVNGAREQLSGKVSACAIA